MRLEPFCSASDTAKWVALWFLLAAVASVPSRAQDPDRNPTDHTHSKRMDWLGGFRDLDQNVNPISRAADAYLLQLKLGKLLKDKGYAPEAWTPLGPRRFVRGNSADNRVGGMGRINCLAFHPTDPRRIYAGSAGGGLWLSNDDGQSWDLVSIDPRTLMVSGLAIDPEQPETMYLLTGDGNGSVYSLFPEGPSIGVLKSLDGGRTWDFTGLDWRGGNFQFGFKLVMDPNDSRVLYVPADSGLYRSVDAGDAWDLVQAGKFRDIEFKPGDACQADGRAMTCVAYASTTTEVFRTDDAGKTWSAVAMGVSWQGSTARSRRIELAVSQAPGAEETVYALVGAGAGLVGLYRSNDSGVAFELASNTPNILGYKSYGGDTASVAKYTMAFAVSPTDGEHLVTGGVANWQSRDGGKTWRRLTFWQNLAVYRPFLHADTHSLDFRESEPGSGKYDIYCTHDGGIAKSEDSGETWEDLSNDLAITRVYRLCGSRRNPDLLYYGAQDVGSSRLDGGVGHVAFGLDGMECLIDYNNEDTVYVSAYNGLLLKSTDRGQNFVSVSPPGMASKGPWVTPFVMHPRDPNTIYACYSDLWRSEDGGAIWHNVTNGYLGDNDCVQIAVAESDPEFLYVAKEEAVYRTGNGGKSWTFTPDPIPNQGESITNLAVSTSDPERVWVTLGGYTDGIKVFASNDGAESWENISGSLPNVPAYALAYDKETDGLYLGNSIGVYYRSWESRPDCLLECRDWAPFVNGLPPLIVFDMEIHQDARKIRAATWSMGVWEAPLHVLGRHVPPFVPPGRRPPFRQ